MRATRVLGTVGLAMLLPAFAAVPRTTYDYDKTAPFTAYRTYALVQGSASGNPRVDGLIVAALQDQLTLKGLSKTSVRPDVNVLFHVALDTRKDISALSTGPLYGGYGWRWGEGWGSTATNVRVREIVAGTLVVDVVDGQRKQVVWRGLGTKAIAADATPDARDMSIAKAVEKIMRNYPPVADDD